MSAERESRLTENETAQELAAKPTTTSVKPIQATTAKPTAKHGASVEKSLAALLARLMADEIGLDDLTASLAGFYLAGHAAALASSLPELTRVERERDEAVSSRDTYYRAAFDPRTPITIGPSHASLQQIRAQMYSGGAA